MKRPSLIRLWLLAAAINAVIILAAAQTVVQPLRPGDPVPPLVLDQLYNHHEPVIRLADLRGKLVLLDFWNTRCGGCIKGLRKLDSLLRHRFADDLVVITVTYEPEETVSRFWQQNTYLSGIRLPAVTGDTLLRQLFPHTGVPHLAWIGRDGRLLHTTTSAYANGDDIQLLLDGQATGWLQHSSRREPDFSQLLWDWPMADSSEGPRYYSLLSGYRHNMRSYKNIRIDSLSGTITISMVNVNVLGFSYLIHRNDPQWQHLRDSLLAAHPQAMNYRPEYGNTDRWRQKNRFCYELRLPYSGPADLKRVFAIMQEDLRRYFPATTTH